MWLLNQQPANPAHGARSSVWARPACSPRAHPHSLASDTEPFRFEACARICARLSPFQLDPRSREKVVFVEKKNVKDKVLVHFEEQVGGHVGCPRALATLRMHAPPAAPPPSLHGPCTSLLVRIPGTWNLQLCHTTQLCLRLPCSVTRSLCRPSWPGQATPCHAMR